MVEALAVSSNGSNPAEWQFEVERSTFYHSLSHQMDTNKDGQGLTNWPLVDLTEIDG